MSIDGSITIEWGQREYCFRLALGEMRQLQEAINRPRVALGAPLIGPMSLLRELQAGDAWPNDVREIIRLGLIGGGMKAYDALTLVKERVEQPGQLMAATLVAYQVVSAAVIGDPSDPVGKPEPVSDQENQATTTGSNSQASTGPALQ